MIVVPVGVIIVAGKLSGLLPLIKVQSNENDERRRGNVCVDFLCTLFLLAGSTRR